MSGGYENLSYTSIGGRGLELVSSGDWSKRFERQRVGIHIGFWQHERFHQFHHAGTRARKQHAETRQAGLR